MCVPFRGNGLRRLHANSSPVVCPWVQLFPIRAKGGASMRYKFELSFGLRPLSFILIQLWKLLFIPLERESFGLVFSQFSESFITLHRKVLHFVKIIKDLYVVLDPGWQSPKDVSLLVPFIQQVNRTIILRVPYDPSYTLVDGPHCLGHVPLASGH